MWPVSLAGVISFQSKSAGEINSGILFRGPGNNENLHFPVKDMATL
tara:strand:- start:1032 stop:1169 length:138 start_codon:yes stop_codon:yes gene_type:complete